MIHWGPTEIYYLEHRFYQIATDANRYVVKNGNDPTAGNPSEEKQSELEDFIEYVQIIVGMLGHKVFVPLISFNDSNGSGYSQELYCSINKGKAIGVITPDGFVVKKGSTISQNIAAS